MTALNPLQWKQNKIIWIKRSIICVFFHFGWIQIFSNKLNFYNTSLIKLNRIKGFVRILKKKYLTIYQICLESIALFVREVLQWMLYKNAMLVVEEHCNEMTQSKSIYTFTKVNCFLQNIYLFSLLWNFFAVKKLFMELQFNEVFLCLTTRLLPKVGQEFLSLSHTITPFKVPCPIRWWYFWMMTYIVWLHKCTSLWVVFSCF